MILSRFVFTKLSPSNVEYWKSKGYPVFPVGGRAGKNTGRRIKVRVSDLKPGSNAQVSCRCDFCGQKYLQRYSRNTDVCYTCRKSNSMKGNTYGKNKKEKISLSESQIDSLRRGKRIKELAKEINFNHVSLTNFLKRHNICTLPTKEILEEYANKKYSMVAISKELKRSPQIIKNLIKKYDIKLDPNLQKKDYDINLIKELNCSGKTTKDIGKILNISDVRVSQLVKEHNIDWIFHPNITNFSKPEQDILSLVKKYDSEAKKRRFDRIEFDIVSFKFSFAIEYCGLYWHSSQFKEKDYHYKKYLKAKDLGLKLITIFEDEWLQKREIVESIIRKNCKIIDNKIYARKTKFLEIKKETAKDFHEKNHIQSVKKYPKFSFGLYQDENLCAVMSFDTHHRNNNLPIVLSRYSTLLDYQILGGASKLFKNSQEKLLFDECISWSDNRWFDGQVYEKLDFILDEELLYDYSYVYGNKRKSKQSHTKNSIGCPKTITEKAFLESKGIYRIYDCGKKRWKWKRGD